jgi:hypothetical protein
MPQGRYFSLSSITYVALFLILFWIGASMGAKRAFRARPDKALLNQAWNNRFTASNTIQIIFPVSLALVVTGVALQLFHIFLLASDQSRGFGFETIVFHRIGFRNATVQGVTILKFLSLPGFVIATVGVELSKKWSFWGFQKRFRIIQIFSLVTPAFSAFLGTRLIPLMWAVPFFYLKIGFSYRLSRDRQRFQKFLKHTLAIILLFGVLYSAGHYVRHYTRVMSGQVAIKPYAVGNEDFLSYTFLDFLSCPFRTVNNGMVIVDHIKNHSYFWRSFRWLYSGFGIESLDPGGFIQKAKDDMYQLDHLGLAYFGATNASLPGFLFIDMGWFALFAIFLLGLFVGGFYQLWRKTTLSGWLVTPLLVTPLLDSWRTDIFFRSINMVCLLTAIASSYYIKRRILSK